MLHRASFWAPWQCGSPKKMDMERHPKTGTRRINNPFPMQPSGLGFVRGDLLFNSTGLASQSHTVGQGFEVRWQVEDGGSLQVYHNSEPKRVLWHTVAGKSFVSAALGRDSFEENRGSITIHDQVEILCSHQSVEEITLEERPSEIIIHPKTLPSKQFHPRAANDPEKPETIKTPEIEFAPQIDADGTLVGNRGPCVIVTGYLYANSTLAIQQLNGYSSSYSISSTTTKAWPGPFEVPEAADLENERLWRKEERDRIAMKESRVGVRYELVFYETREHQLGFSVNLDQPIIVESCLLPIRKGTVVPTIATTTDADDQYDSLAITPNRRHWLWSKVPLSAFSSHSTVSASGVDASRSRPFGSGRRITPVGDVRMRCSLSDVSVTTGSPVPNLFPSRLKFKKLAQFLRVLHVDEDQRFQLPRLNRVQLTYSTSKQENFFGFGEQFSHFNLKGRRVPIFVQEQGIGRGDQPVTALANLISNRSGGDWHTTYAAVPFYMTSEMRSLYLEGYEYAVFDLRHHDAVQLQVHAGFMHGRILHGKTPAEIIERYTAATGRMRELPAWILKGAVVGMQGGLHAVQKVWQVLRDLEVPLAAFWLQDWVGQRRTSVGWQLWWNWEVDRDQYPGWEQLVQEFRCHGIRTMAYCNPFLATTDEKPNRQRDLLDEAHRQGFVVGDKTGAPYMILNTSFDAAMVDLTNLAARTWLKGVLHSMVQTGIRGWMADFGEALPLDSSLSSGEDPRAVHNQYPELWAELNREFVEEWEAQQRELRKSRTLEGGGVQPYEEEDEDDEKLVFFTRAGYRASPRWSTLFWEGDQMVSWQRNDGIKSAVTGLLTGGLCGYSLNHSDIGGYCTVDVPLVRYRRSEELLLRWMELNAFSTIFRTHEGNVPEANSQFYSNARTLHHFSRFARVYKAWEFYRRSLVKEAARTGLPVVRHLFLHYPHDSHVQSFTYQQFLVGNEFLVVPVLDKGWTRVEAYFPRGTVPEAWEHVWTGKVYTSSPHQGLTAWIDAPLGKPAVFTRKGSLIASKFKKNLLAEGIMLD